VGSAWRQRWSSRRPHPPLGIGNPSGDCHQLVRRVCGVGMGLAAAGPGGEKEQRRSLPRGEGKGSAGPGAGEAMAGGFGATERVRESGRGPSQLAAISGGTAHRTHGLFPSLHPFHLPCRSCHARRPWRWAPDLAGLVVASAALIWPLLGPAAGWWAALFALVPR